MFYKCSILTNINLTNFNTNNENDMCGMFSLWASLTNINLSNFNNNMTDMSFMFYNNYSLTKKKCYYFDKKILKFIKINELNII